MHGISLPQVAKVGTLEAAVRFGALLGEELGRRCVPERQLAAQGARGDSLFRDRLRGVHAQSVDDGARRAMRLLAFERFGAVEGFGGDAARLAPVVAGFRLETLESILLVLALPASQCRHADGGAGRVGNLVVAGRDQLAQAALAAGLELVAQQGQDERVAEQRNRRAALLGIDTFRHASTSWMGVGATRSVPAGQGAGKTQNSGRPPDRRGGSQRGSGRIARSGDQRREIGLERPGWRGGQDRRPEQAGWKRLALQPMDQKREELSDRKVEMRQAGLDLSVELLGQEPEGMRFFQKLAVLAENTHPPRSQPNRTSNPFEVCPANPKMSGALDL
jgi:hypothetical protein